MADHATLALHQINSGIRDVLMGFETLIARGDPEILPVARDLQAMHQRHADAVSARLAALGEATDDASLRGNVNKAVTTLRDWVGGLDADALSFVRRGEEMLVGVYEGAMETWPTGADPESHDLAKDQFKELMAATAALPDA